MHSLFWAQPVYFSYLFSPGHLSSCPRIHSSECQRRYACHTICLHGQSQTSRLQIHAHHSSLCVAFSVAVGLPQGSLSSPQMEWASLSCLEGTGALCWVELPGWHLHSLSCARPSLLKAPDGVMVATLPSWRRALGLRGAIASLGNSFLQRVEESQVLKELQAAA